ncbi:rpsU-divergently transcribed protein [Acetobacter papayae]|uniref:rpsU-divergently transcribed protein n=1 Tax=Acetobacter papayae TaxID=1076592 RepID=UPI0039E978FB
MSMRPANLKQAVSLAATALATGVMPQAMPRDPARDAALRALAAVAGERGWGLSVLRDVAGAQAELLFPGGEAELVEAWSDLCDRDMLAHMQDTPEPRLSLRVREALLYRLPLDEAMRRAASRGVSAQLVGGGQAAFRRGWMRTVNAIWMAARDESSGATYLTKRLTLAQVYGATFLYWLAGVPDEAALAAFVDRRLACVRRLGQARGLVVGRVMGLMGLIRPQAAG